VLTALNIRDFVTNWTPDYQGAAVRVAQAELKDARPKLLVTVDVRSANVLRAYFQFRVPADVTIVSADRLSPKLVHGHARAVLLVNEDASRYEHRAYGLPSFLDDVAQLGLSPLYDDHGYRVFALDHALLTRFAGLVSAPH
jgi:hypothetical protein